MVQLVTFNNLLDIKQNSHHEQSAVLHTKRNEFVIKILTLYWHIYHKNLCTVYGLADNFRVFMEVAVYHQLLYNTLSSVTVMSP